MSQTAAVPIAAAPVALAVVAAAVAGGVCYVAGKVGMEVCKEAMKSCKEIYEMCKEGKYPVEKLQMVYTPLSNFNGLTNVLSEEGFTIKSVEGRELMQLSDAMKMSSLKGSNIGLKEDNRIQMMSDSGNNNIPDTDISIAVNNSGKSIFLVSSESGISLISDNLDLVHSAIQDFATHEIVASLKKNDFKVNVEKKETEKIISAVDSQKNRVNLSIKKGDTTINFDTRKTKRPKCDIIHQTIKSELHKKNRSNCRIDSLQQKRKREDVHLKVGS